MRIYDPRLGRFLSVDLLTKDYPELTPYQFAGNTPIAAVDLDGKEPKIVVTDQVTGSTKIKVYGQGNVKEMIVKTYKAVVQYTDKKGHTTIIASFHVTKDRWYDMGTDLKGNTILVNRSSDQGNSGKVYIQHKSDEQYGKGTHSFTMSSIYSPIPEKYNSMFFDNGSTGEKLPPDVIRKDNLAQSAQFHVGGYYEKKNGELSLGGTYGCLGIVDPSQVSTLKTNNPVTSNEETRRFAEAVDTANKKQVKEHGKPAKTEVELQKRQYNKVKIVENKDD